MKYGRFVDTGTLARISSLDLLARTVVEGFVSGLHRSPFLGRSMDFAEYRAYQPGDDIRRVDWKLFCRTDRFYVKEFEADTNTNLTIALDVSRSMDFGTGALTKLDYGRYLAACLGYFASKQKDRIGLVTFDSGIVDYVPPAAKHLQVVLHTIDRIESGGGGSLREPLLEVVDAVRRRSIVVLISDFYEEPETVIRTAAGFRHKGNDVILFHLLDPAELRFDFDGELDLRDLETGAREAVMPDVLRDQYLELIREHTRTLDRSLVEAGIDYTLVDISQPLDAALYSYLSARLYAMKAR